MTVEIIQKNFYEYTSKRLSNTSQLNLFNILKDIKTDIVFLNIFKSFILSEEIQHNIDYFSIYFVDENDNWDLISQKHYNTPYLWWIIALANNIINPFESLEAGQSLKILKESYLFQLFEDIRFIGNQY